MERLVEKQECGELFCKYDSYKCIDQEEDGGCQYCEHFSNILKKLHDYEDAEEQGLLLRLPCKLGDDVFVFREYLECKYDYECNDKDAYKCECGDFCENEYKSVCIGKTQFQLQMFTELGKTVFRTKAEAEKALEEMG